MRKLIRYTLLLTVVLAVAATVQAGGKKKPVKPNSVETVGNATSAAPFRFQPGKTWISGICPVDSASNRTISFRFPTLNDEEDEMRFIDVLSGAFACEAETVCAGLGGIIYDGSFMPLYLIPGDTLHITFSVRDSAVRTDTYVAFPMFDLSFAGRSGKINDHIRRFDLFKAKYGHDAPKGRTLETFKSQQDSICAADLAELDRYIAANDPPREFIEAMRSDIIAACAYYSAFPMFQGWLPAVELPKIYDGRYPCTEDRHLVTGIYQSYLDQCINIPVWSDTTGRYGAADNSIVRLDELCRQYPESLSRDVMCLQLCKYFYGVMPGKADSMNIESYIQDPAVRAAYDIFRLRIKADKEKAQQNLYELPFTSDQQFIADLFAPYKGKGKVLYVDFWGIGCGYCYQQTPYAIEMAEALKDSPVEFIYICLHSDKKDAGAYLSRTGLDKHGRHIILDKQQSAIIQNYFQFSGIPRYWMIDKDGKFISDDADRPSEKGTRADLEKLAAQ